MKLTERQREELARLASAPQRTYGKWRTRVQNNLVRLGLAYYLADLCYISHAGTVLFLEPPAPQRDPKGVE